MTSPAAAALDAADGVMDGRHFGRPIVQAGAQPAFFGAQPAFGGFAQAQPAFFGAQQFGGFAQPTVFGGASSAALALDAADGVIDGKSFGRPIIQAGAPTFLGAQQFGGFAQPTIIGAQQFGGFSGYPTAFGGFAQPATVVGGGSAAALALDAADGVIDGRSFGRPIVQAQPAFYGAQQFAAPTTVLGGFSSFGATQFGGFAQPTVFGGASSAALALDAADGVIDGTSFGRPIVQAGGLVPYTGVAATQFGGFPQQFGATAISPAFGGYGAAVPAQLYGQQRFAGYGGGFPAGQYAGAGAYPGYGATYAGVPPQFANGGRAVSARKARKLDAADGVIDGRHYGQPIMQKGRRH